MLGLVIITCGSLCIAALLVFLTAQAISNALILAVKQPQNIKAWNEFRAYKRNKLIDKNREG